MADTKLSALTAAASASGDDLILITDDPGGTPTSKKLTITALFTSPRITTDISDANGNEIIKTPATASAVNEITVTNAATNTSPIIGATGGDTHINLKLDAKGTAAVVVQDPLVRIMTAAAVATAGAHTITVAQILGGIVERDPAGASRTDTGPTAADLVAAIPNAAVGMTFAVWYLNNADAAETITIAAGASGTLKNVTGNDIIARNTARTLLFRLTNVTAASEAYDLYVM